MWTRSDNKGQAVAMATTETGDGHVPHVALRGGSDAIDIRGRVAATLAVGTVVAQTPALAAGVYDVSATTDCYLAVAADASGVTMATGYQVYAGNVVPLVVGDQQRIGVIAAAAGTLRYHRVA